jgi:hypothetical protein
LLGRAFVWLRPLQGMPAAWRPFGIKVAYTDRSTTSG